MIESDMWLYGGHVKIKKLLPKNVCKISIFYYIST